MDTNLQKVLNAREQRWEMRNKIVQKRNRCLITVTLCVPVVYRTSDEFWEIFINLCGELWKTLISRDCGANFEGYLRNEDGPAYFITVNADAAEIKKICIDAENSITGGRLLDIDVMDKNGISISRSDIGMPPRKCFVCDRPAAVCVSRKFHSPDEISAYVEQLKEQIKVKR